ncbi:MAG: hypothetical protein JRN20_05765 [Nitrososphaerota archaeon]|nr:hypothetical protein [Nitrososphaerota archaeon]MDG6921859.1 hypothetical protein [Nitrososphaerota archaeon]
MTNEPEEFSLPRAELVKNLIDICRNSPERVSILKAVRKQKNYADVAKKLDISPTGTSRILKMMKRAGLVAGKLGNYRQSQGTLTINIDSVVKQANQEQRSPLIQSNSKSAKPGKRTVSLKLSEEQEFSNVGLPQSVIREALDMAGMYPYFYVFENAVRYFIKDNLESKYGTKWWESKVAKPVQQTALERMSKDGKNRWHGKRGAHPIFYVDIGDLRSIIISNQEDLKDKFPAVRRPIDWITQRIEEIEMSRNVVAHNNPLSQNDIDRVKVYFKDWALQMAIN